MRRMFFQSLIVLMLAAVSGDLHCGEQAECPFSKIAEKLAWKGIAVEEKDYSIWGTSPVPGPDGKIHLFVARWPEMNVTPGWRKSSEIAHYVGESPEGPFTFSDIALQGTGRDTWDKYGAHNPEIHQVGDEYVLLYIANTDYHQPPHPSNQRIGMAFSKSLYGPWEKVSGHGMIIEKSEDPGHWTYTSANGLSNPTFIHSEGKYYVYFKTRPGNRTTQYGVAVADHLQGPYRILDRPVTESGFLFEDPNAFIWNERHYLIADDNFGEFTGIRGGGILWHVTDFLKLNTQDIQIGFDLIPWYYENYNEQIVTKIYGDAPKFERPKILSLDGKPAYLYAASGWNVYGGPRTVSYVLKINLPDEPGDTNAEKTNLNAAVIPVPSMEDRAAAAGWTKGGTWMDQHEDINRLGQSRKVDLVFLGNSITQSWGGEGRNVRGVGTDAWNTYFSPMKAVNFGISGDRTQHLLWRITNGNLDAISPRLIVLLIGTNNLNHNSEDEIVEGIGAIVNTLREKLPDTKILLLGIFPRGEKPDDPSRKRITVINNSIRSLADDQHVYVRDIGHIFLHPDGTANTELMAEDCLHLRPAGYTAWAEALQDIFMSINFP